MIELKVPALGESIVEATIARWVKKVGDFVKQDELLVEIETDKVTLEVTAPSSGKLNSILFEQGAIIKIGDIIANIDESAVEADASVQVSSMSQSTIVSQSVLSEPVSQSVSSEILQSAEKPLSSSLNIMNSSSNNLPLVNEAMFDQASPAVRKRIAEGALDPKQLQASRLDGRLVKEDLVAGVSASQTLVAQERQESRVPMSRLRLRIAERLKDAQNTAAILTTVNEIDMTAVKFLRDRYKDQFEKKYGIKLGFMSFFVKACVKALQDIPAINSKIEGNDIVSSNYCDIGVAVSAPNGLMVPIIRDADLMDLHEIESAIAEYGQKAKNNKLSIDDMSGGTFTISNGGVFGSLLSTPIINPPQSAILGMHKIQDRPVAINGRVEIRPMMYVALSYDHRLVDGREAVTFLVSIKESVENPGRFLLGL